jgi:uncharacterized coiled-coil protein SlyX
MEAVLPHLVTSDDAGFKGVAYERLGVYALAGIKELDAKQAAREQVLAAQAVKIAAQEEKIATLEEQLKALAAAVEALQSQHHHRGDEGAGAGGAEGASAATA